MACTEDVLEVMELGQRNRSVAETKMNERSSRSHSVLTVIVDGLNNVTGIRTHGCLHLIDLAGAVLESLLSGYGVRRVLLSPSAASLCTLASCLLCCAPSHRARICLMSPLSKQVPEDLQTL